MKKKSINSKQFNYIITFVVVLVFFVLGILVYNNLFGSSNSKRLDNIENYKLTNNEIDSVKDKLNELEKVKYVKVYTNYKIIKIFVSLTEDIDFEKVKTISNSLLEKLKEDNLNYYDVEIFVESANSSSEIYPKIGYKHKTSKEFVW